MQISWLALSGLFLHGVLSNPRVPSDAWVQQSQEVWAGHQVVEGKRDIAIIGSVPTRTESFVLAQVTRRGDAIDIEQRACRVEFKEVLGVAVRMPTQTLARLPRAQFRFTPKADSSILQAGPWVVAWGTEDLDQDGRPGLTVEVEATMCGGSVYVASATTSEATGTLTPDGMRGHIAVRVMQEVLDASGFCLRVASQDSNETQTGRFAYRRVPKTTTCANLAKQRWPVWVEPTSEASREHASAESPQSP